MKSKAWWKKNWLPGIGVACGVLSVTFAAFAMGPYVLFMWAVGFSTAVLLGELWNARNDK